MTINPSDIHYDYSAMGYMLYYKGKPIGGAGISKGEECNEDNILVFKHLAESTVNAIVNGHGQERYMIEIEKIEKSIETEDGKLWVLYTQYLINWADEHNDVKFVGMSPASFEEWKDNELTEEME